MCVNRICLALVGLALISACKRGPEPMLPDASEAAPERAGLEVWTLTPKMVDGYLRYQRTLLVQAGRISVPAWDGGLKQFDETATIEQKATLDERARMEAGLSPDDVLKIEAMLSRVSARRVSYRMMRLDEKTPTLPEPDPDDPTKGAELEKSLQDRLRLKKAMEDLPEEREAFGSHNIDALLQQEEELLKNWGMMMGVPDLAPKGQR